MQFDADNKFDQSINDNIAAALGIQTSGEFSDVVLACRRSGLSSFWLVVVLVCRRFGLSSF